MDDIQPNQIPNGSTPLPTDGQKVIERKTPDVDKQRAELVKTWVENVEEAKKYWGDAFQKMRDNAKFAAGKQWPGQQAKEDRYVANITLRHINQRVSAIYAKNPRVRALRKPKLYCTVWDGSMEMLQAAVQSMAGASSGIVLPGGMEPEQAMQVLAEAQQAAQQKQMYDRMGKTLEIVAQYSLDEPIPKFKTQAKQLVRRVLTCGVGYIKLGYQRLMQYNSADIDTRLKDVSDRLAEIEAVAARVADGETPKDSAEAEQLKLNLAALQKQKELVAREGLVFSFPKAWSIIPDTNVTQLKGFVGAKWIAEEYLFTTKEVEKIYKIDVSESYTAHTTEGGRADKRKKKESLCAVYEIYDLESQTCFTVCAGYPDYLKEPGDPNVALEQFHPFYSLYFNDTEDPERIIPPADVELISPMQVEYNRGREGIRVHRQANRPATVTVQGVFDEATKTKFSTHVDHELIETNLSKSDDINKLLAPKPTVPIQPELYDVEHVFVDTQRVSGTQEADLGGTSGSTATEVTVAANSQVSSTQSCIDDLDEFLTDVMRGAGQILLLEMSEETVKKIAGPGAVWPTLSKKEVAEELYLEIKAGSSGRPNKAGRLASLEKAVPFLMQIPGIKSKKMADFILTELDEGIDVDDFYDTAMPSIVAQNAMAKPNLAPQPGGTAQAAQGGANAQQPQQSPGKEQNMHQGAVDPLQAAPG